MKRAKDVIPMSVHAREVTADDVRPTRLPDAFLESTEAQQVMSFSLPLFEELPDLNLYRDQVVTYVENVLKPLEPFVDSPVLTPAMINNYVKSGLLPSPVKKTYTRVHVARLLIICLFKQILSMDAIMQLLRIQQISYPFEVAYDYIAAQITQALQTTFCLNGEDTGDTARQVTRESLLVRSAALAFASKVYLMAYIRFSGFSE